MTARLAAAMMFATGMAHAERTIQDFPAALDLKKIETRDVRLTVEEHGWLRLEAGHAIEWPGITLKPDGKAWDLTPFGAVSLDVRNPSATPVEVGLRIDNPGGDGGTNCVQEIFPVAPGETKTLSLPLRRRLPPAFGLFGMRGYPGRGAYANGDHAVDPANLIQLLVFVPRPTGDHVFAISRVRATGEAPPLPDAKGFFPFIDRFGQYRHAEWPGKLHDATEWPARIAAESADLGSHPAPADRDRWGGWKDGPTLTATGFFRPDKHDGRWWLVDPDGRLFWSWGADCVGHWAGGPIADRERWFAELPRTDPAYKDFFFQQDSRADDRYKGRQVEYFDFGRANAFRKWGTAFEDAVADQAHRRLASWGMNTIGNWSWDSIYLKRRTPYTVAVHFGGPELKGSEGYWSNFRDVFDPGFREALRERLQSEKQTTAGDPWCLGYFVDNEISWGDETDLGTWTLVSPPGQKAKVAFITALKRKYGTIAALNAVWGTTHASWDALLAARTPPDKTKARADLVAWTAATAEEYFKVCSEEIHRIAPKNLYLGCRFAWVNDEAVKAAVRHCDVVSYNLYRRSVADFKLPAGLDAPVIIGEFHFGALDRGMFHEGLVPCRDQAERASALQSYVEGAAANPVLVGAHWFQYLDEPTAGRFDGENYQIGLVDITDTPYPETIAAVRAAGAGIYRLHGGRP